MFQQKRATNTYYNMDNIIALLHTGEYSCVISNGSDVRTFVKGGVADLYELHENDLPFLNGSSVADKVVGKAAAALMILGGVAHIHADVISEPAMALLNDTQIEVRFAQLVPFIGNRDRSGVCPLESICRSAHSPQELFPLIKAFIERIRNKAYI
jgi:iron complex outermembrane receptor protein/vitamin B12 transporter